MSLGLPAVWTLWYAIGAVGSLPGLQSHRIVVEHVLEPFGYHRAIAGRVVADTESY